MAMALNKCAYYFGITIAILTFPISVPLAIFCCSDKEAVAAESDGDNPAPPAAVPSAPPDYYNPVIVASAGPTEGGDDEPTDVRE
jgi:hypothetical protein